MLNRIFLTFTILLIIVIPVKMTSPVDWVSKSDSAVIYPTNQAGPGSTGLTSPHTVTNFFMPAIFNSRLPGWHTYLDTKAECYYDIDSLAMVSAYEGWAVGDGYVFHIFNGSCQQVEIPAYDIFNTIVMVSPTEGWTVGSQGTILHYLLIFRYPESRVGADGNGSCMMSQICC